MALDSSYFLEQVKLKGSIPTGRFDDSEILAVAHDVLLAHVVPLIVSLKEEYYVQSEDQNITANVSAYPIPYRAMGLSLREAKKVVNSSILDLGRMSPEDIISTSTGTPTKFYLQSSDVILYPTPSSTQDTLRLSYYKTPNKVVTVAECALITAIDSNTGIITATPPTDWVVTDEMDFISRQNGHRCLDTDITPTGITTTTITFTTTDIPSSLAVGDYIALAGETPYLEVPDVCFDLIVRLTVNDLLESMGDQAGLQAGLARVEILKQNVVSLLTNRVQGALKKTSIKLI